MKWRMKTGTLIEISDMSDDHLINAYRLCERRGVVSGQKMESFFDDPPDGAAAEDAFFVDWLLNRYSPAISALEEELVRRGIKGVISE